jgi:putative hydrolase of the HAD superfamily
MKAINSLVLDFGNVITLPPDEAVIDRMVHEVMGGPKRAGGGKARRAPFLAVYSAFRNEYDRGTLSAADYWRTVGSALGADLSPSAIDRLRTLDTECWFRFDPAMVAWFQSLRPGLRHLALLSNINEDGVSALHRRASWLGIFDLLVFSCEHRVLKPEPEIYRLLIEGLGVEPVHCLFVDDLEENVEGAKAAGLNTHRYTGMAGLQAEFGDLYRLAR